MMRAYLVFLLLTGLYSGRDLFAQDEFVWYQQSRKVTGICYESNDPIRMADDVMNATGSITIFDYDSLFTEATAYEHLAFRCQDGRWYYSQGLPGSGEKYVPVTYQTGLHFNGTIFDTPTFHYADDYMELAIQLKDTVCYGTDKDYMLVCIDSSASLLKKMEKIDRLVSNGNDLEAMEELETVLAQYDAHSDTFLQYYYDWLFIRWESGQKSHDKRHHRKKR